MELRLQFGRMKPNRDDANMGVDAKADAGVKVTGAQRPRRRCRGVEARGKVHSPFTTTRSTGRFASPTGSGVSGLACSRGGEARW